MGGIFIVCKHCGTSFESKHCPECGKPANGTLFTRHKAVILTVCAIVLLSIFAVVGIAMCKKNTVVKNVGKFKSDNYTLTIGESTTLSILLSPKNVTKKDFSILTDTSAVKISNITLKSTDNKTRLNFKCTAKNTGNATVWVADKNGNKISDNVYFTALSAPTVKTIGKFKEDNISLNVGDTATLTVIMTPKNITKDDFGINISDTKVITADSITLNSTDTKTVLKFTVTALKDGTADLNIVATDNKTNSNKLKFTVLPQTDENEEEDIASSTAPTTSSNNNTTSSTPVKKTLVDSDTVYITPSGEKYHVSATCGGKNATATTLKTATEKGRTPCKKCAD